MKNKDDIKVVIAENSVILRSGLTSVLKRFSEYNFQINEISGYDALLLFMRLHTPEILIINPFFIAGFNVAAIKKEFPALKTIAFLPSFIDSKIASDYDASISIYDSADVVCEKIADLFNEPDESETQETDQLSAREKEIVGYVVKGWPNKTIADHLSISIHTVITHRRNIATKLQIPSSAGFAIYAIANKIVELQDNKDEIN